jgi:hypothetical protein
MTVCKIAFRENNNAMTTITLEYNEHDKTAKQMIEIILSLGLAKRKKNGLEKALDDVENGRLETVHTPENWKRA